MNRFTARLRYFIADAVDEWRHSPGVNLLATGTLAAVLFVAGLVLLLMSNLENHLERLRKDLRVEVYLTESCTEEQRTALQDALAVQDGVSRVEYVDKEEALRRFRTWFSDVAELTGELGGNPLPASLEVYLASERDAGAVAAEIAGVVAGREGVEEVRYDREWIDRAEAYLDLVRVGGLVLALLVLAAVVFVIASVLRLAVYARRDEIDIMLLVGATPGFVRGPFLVAGLSQGLVASLAAILSVEIVRRAVQAYTGSRTGALLALIASEPLGWTLMGLLVLCGVAVSFIGSYFAVRQDPYAGV